MAKSGNEEDYLEKQTWSTLEELLLACAVHRHGIDSWDSVAAEIQKQSSSFGTLTGFDCRHKYNDLKRRFSRKLISSGSVDGEIGEISSVPWLDELRKLRVDELRREVERYDLSISSLQLKVKRLEDEREKSLKEEETEAEISDLDKKEDHRESGDNVIAPTTEPADSPNPKVENTNRDVKIVESEPNTIVGEDNDDEKPARENSCRGSCESVAKESAANSDRADPGTEFVESMDESKGEEEEAKETSDVQSSASLSRKETIEQHEPDNDDQSLTVNRIPIQSRPLIDFIEILQSNPICSHFSRRLESQDTQEYDKIIRQHINFEMIRTRIEEGSYESSKSKFFRDLLLLINNLRMFYGERSSESNAINQLNKLIKRQMTLKVPKQEESLVKILKEEVTVSSLKPAMSVPILACRKRSSLAVRSSEPFKEKTKTVPTIDEKPVSEEDEISDKEEELIISKKTTKGRTISTANKVGSRNVTTSLNDSSEQKKSDQERKSNNNKNGGSKKQSAARFLNRMKGISSSEPVIETMKTDSSDRKRGAEQRRSSNSKNDKVVDARKPSTGQKRAIAKKVTTEKSSPSKKNTSAGSKRGSETSEKEAGSSSRPKKRSRRL